MIFKFSVLPLCFISLLSSQVTAQDVLPFSSVVEANGVIYLAGHLGYEPESREYPKGGIGPQTKQTLDNIGATLKTVNADFSDIVRCQVFLTDPKDFKEMNAAYRRFFPKNPPARTTVSAALVSREAKIEIECTAVRGHGQKMATKE